MDAGEVVFRRKLLRVRLVLEEVLAQALGGLHRSDRADVGDVAGDAALHAVGVTFDGGLREAREELLDLDVEVRLRIVLLVLLLDRDVGAGARVLERRPRDQAEEHDAEAHEDETRPHTGELSPGCPRMRVQSQLKASPRKNSPMTTKATARHT